MTYNQNVEVETDNQPTINTNMGVMPLEDYLEIRATQMGFESYADLREQGFSISDVENMNDAGNTIEDKIIEQTKGHEETVSELQAFGYEMAWSGTVDEGFSRDGFIFLRDTHNSDPEMNVFGFDGWEAIESEINDIYRAVDMFSLENLQLYHNGNYDVIDYGTFSDMVIHTAIRERDTLIEASNIALKTGNSWRDTFLDLKSQDIKREELNHLNYNGQEHHQKDSQEPEQKPEKDYMSDEAQQLIKKKLIQNGLEPTPGVIKNIQQLNRIMGKEHSLKELADVALKDTYKGQPEAQQLARNIKQDLAAQQMAALVPSL